MSKVTLKLGRTGRDSHILVDGKPVPKVYEVDVQSSANGRTTATVKMYVDEVEAELDPENVTVVKQDPRHPE